MSYVRSVMCDKATRFSYPLLMNLFVIYCKCLDFTNKESLDDITKQIYDNFLEAINIISVAANVSKENNKEVVVRSFSYILINS